MKVLTFFVVAILGLAAAQDLVLESPRVTNWGNWGPMEMCPPNSFVYGMRLKTERYQGTFSDDSALNGIELLCITTAKRSLLIKAFSTVSSRVGQRGAQGNILECPEPGFATGFQLRSEKDQGWYADDTAANNLRLFCSTGQTLDGDGMGYGDLTDERRCPRGTYLCGIQTQVEDPTSDYTGLNNVNMGCCSVSKTAELPLIPTRE